MIRHEFESSTVIELILDNGAVILGLLIEPEGKEKYRLLVSSAKLMQCDISNIKNLRMEAGDGEIRHLEYTDKNLKIIIEWNEFSQPTKQFTMFYEFTGTSIEVNQLKN